MKERPIIFSGPMVRAILEGRKTQTRRVFKGLTPPDCPGLHTCVVEGGVAKFHLDGKLSMHSGEWTACPHGSVGDRLWARETWSDVRSFGFDKDLFPLGAAYKADCKGGFSLEIAKDYGVRWRPSIHMPRWASRITLEITGVRVERLREISEEDAMAEGWHPADGQGPCEWFEDLWESIHGPGSWDANPWVWVIEFKRNDKLTRDAGTQKL